MAIFLDLFQYDKELNCEKLCGVDEAGRGPLAGDVYAAAVILPADCYIEGLNDSKKLTEKKRDLLFDEIKEKALSYCIASASINEIEKYNILNATFIAMKRAVEGLSVKPSMVLIDGNKNPDIGVYSRCVIKGDATSASIAAASILAKVARDRYMAELDEKYPEYQFSKHKGYGTRLHYDMLNEYGLSPIHRPSFFKKHKLDNTTKKALVGKLGEDITKNKLEKNGYEIIGTNVSFSGYGEIDIIAVKEDILAFVEVKTRNENSMISAVSAVTKSKQDRIRKSAICFLTENNLSLQPRFDVSEVYINEETKQYKINYIANAFDGSLEDVYL